MKSSGFTLVELIFALSISALLLLSCLSFYQFSMHSLEFTAASMDTRANLRIAMDYLASGVKTAAVVKTWNNVVELDHAAIYLKNNILRAVADSQQIAYGISSFSIFQNGSTGVYRIEVEAQASGMLENERLQAYVFKRN